MKKYSSIERLKEDSSKALEQYRKLMDASAALLYYVSMENEANKKQEVIKNIIDEIGVETQAPTCKTNVPSKEIAENLYKKVQEYRKESPKFVVDMFEEGLKFLEKLCQKYM